MESLSALSVLDGRYHRYTEELNNIFSEYGLIRHRVYVEVEWLKFLLDELKFEAATPDQLGMIDSIASDFDIEGAKRIKDIEKTTNHDVKAVEYYIKQRLSDLGLDDFKEWVHFACTSEDINNTAYALMIRAGRDVIQNQLSELLSRIEAFAKENKSIAMIARTHGQPATPTTVGKEFINFAWRLRLEAANLSVRYIHAKMNGASGNYNAHHFAFPEIDWIDASQQFIGGRLGLTPILYTTQINPYHYISEMLHNLIRIASVVIDFDRDMWGYISISYLKQKTVPGEVGSSTMPHKVNPIDFENSEGNMGIAISMMEHLSVKLLNSRFQRDLTDSTVLRNLGAVLGYLMIGFKSAVKGMNKICVNLDEINNDISDNPELLSEALQTVMRIYKDPNPYEKLKDLTRGHKITSRVLQEFVDSLEGIPEKIKNNMRELTVEHYTGLAEKLVDHYFMNV